MKTGHHRIHRFAALVGRAKGSVTSKYIHTLDTALIMAAEAIAGYIEGLLDRKEFKQTTYALDRDSRKSALAQFLCKAEGKAKPDAEDERQRLSRTLCRQKRLSYLELLSDRKARTSISRRSTR